MRLLVVVTAVVLATICAGDTNTPFLRAIDNGGAEERGIFGTLKGKVKVFETKAKDTRSNANILQMIRKGDDQDTILARMGVKPEFVDAKGAKFYDKEDPGSRKYKILVKYADRIMA